MGCLELHLLKREYWTSVVDVLKNIPKILHITKKDIFQSYFIHIDQ